jgi:PAS domain S-box-containing protein
MKLKNTSTASQKAKNNLALGKQPKVNLLGIIEDMPGNVYWKDTKGVFLGCNLNVAKIAGFSSPADLIGKTELDLFPEEITKKSRIVDEYVLNTKQEKVLEEPGLDLKGNAAIYLTIKKPLYSKDGKKVIGILGISQDITERKRQEEELAKAKERAEAANNAKTVFISSISHDMRTPLSGILGALELIKLQVQSTPKLEKLFASAKKCGDTLIQMMDRVIDFAKREHQGIAVNKQLINFKQLVLDVMDMHRIEAHKKSLTLNLDYNAPDWVVTDYHCAQDILLNLIGNAVKYTDTGEVSVIITGSDKDLTIKVSDTGIGIPADRHKDIFDKFTRVERIDRSKYPGDGLGLSKVKSSVDALEGKILVYSKLGQGSTFEIQLEN